MSALFPVESPATAMVVRKKATTGTGEKRKMFWRARMLVLDGRHCALPFLPLDGASQLRYDAGDAVQEWVEAAGDVAGEEGFCECDHWRADYDAAQERVR